MVLSLLLASEPTLIFLKNKKASLVKHSLLMNKQKFVLDVFSKTVEMACE